YARSSSQRPLVVVGGANYRDAFHDRLADLAKRDPRIRLVGQVHDQQLLKEVWCNCYVYLHGHSVGGTNPALLRAMGYGSCVIALDTPFNREVLADTGLFFAPNADAVTDALDRVERHPSEVAELRR